MDSQSQSSDTEESVMHDDEWSSAEETAWIEEICDWAEKCREATSSEGGWAPDAVNDEQMAAYAKEPSRPAPPPESWHKWRPRCLVSRTNPSFSTRPSSQWSGHTTWDVDCLDLALVLSREGVIWLPLRGSVCYDRIYGCYLDSCWWADSRTRTYQDLSVEDANHFVMTFEASWAVRGRSGELRGQLQGWRGLHRRRRG
ncbi:hypothetical protein BU15DRAFT_69568 [Melanogaster broomeanus]|nr:hypothetical protein BU15DRAFT_69568 [Melanogaster broomeanus]